MKLYQVDFYLDWPVSIEVLNLRDFITTYLMKKGEVLRWSIIEIQKPWASIQIPGPVQVWVYGKYVTQNGDKAEISGIDVRARSMPSTTSSSNILGRFLDKTPVRIISKEGDWVRVSTVNTITTWILLDELEILDTISEEWTNKWNRVRKEL